MTRISGLDGFRRSSALTVVACLQLLAERAGYSKDDRRRLVAHMSETVPSLFAHWQPVIRSEVVATFDKAANDPAVQELGPAFADLLDHVRIAAARPAPAFPEVPAKSLEKLGGKLNRTGAGEPDESGWCVAHSDGGRFSVSFPGRFNDWSASEPGITSHGLGMTTLQGAKFVALSMTRADGQLPPTDGLVNGFRAQGLQVTTRVVQMSGHPGLEIVVEGSTANATFRQVRSGDTQYLVTVEHHPGLKGIVAKDVSRFFDSFRIDTPPGSAP